MRKNTKEAELNPFQRRVYVLQNRRLMYLNHAGLEVEAFKNARLFSQRNYASMALKHFRAKTGDQSWYIVPCLVEQMEMS